MYVCRPMYVCIRVRMYVYVGQLSAILFVFRFCTRPRPIMSSCTPYPSWSWGRWPSYWYERSGTHVRRVNRWPEMWQRLPLWTTSLSSWWGSSSSVWPVTHGNRSEGSSKRFSNTNQVVDISTSGTRSCRPWRSRWILPPTSSCTVCWGRVLERFSAKCSSARKMAPKWLLAQEASRGPPSLLSPAIKLDLK